MAIILHEIGHNFNSALNKSNGVMTSIFTNIQYLLEEKVSKTQKNLEDYFKIYGPIYDENENPHIFESITTFSNMGEEMYHIKFK